MAVTRNVHKFEVSVNSYSDWGTSTWDGKIHRRVTEPKLAMLLNERLAGNERIVGTHYVDGHWIIITETYGLGPPRKQTP